MIKILGAKDFTVFYKCDCGVAGKCMIKPLSDKGTIITNITCPICKASERIKFTQGKDTVGFSWACVIYNEVTDYELMED